MKRYVETDRWRDNFYMELHPYAKLLLSYMYDNCDVCGAIDYNQSLWLTQIQGDLKDKKRYSPFTKQDLVNALQDLQSKLLSDGKKKLFIKDFLFHQNKLPLIKGNEEHELIITKLQSNFPKFNEAPEIKKILESVSEPKKTEEEVKSKKKRGSPFVAPTFEELKEYYLSQKPDAELSAIEDIYDHYVSCGWTVGKDKPMKDWESAVRKAIRNNEKGFKRYNGNNNSGSGENKKSRTETTLSVVEELTRKK